MSRVPASRLPTVTDVATVAGVSRQTVSNVLNSPGIVRADTRGRVERAIADLGYRPHASARRLRTRKSSTIGIRLDPVQNGISGSVLDRFLHAVTEKADARGYRILLYTAAGPDDEIAQFGRLLDGADVDGFVLTSTFFDDPRTEWLIDAGADFVTFGRPWGLDDMADPHHRWVDVDGRAGVSAATLELLDRGASRVAFVGWPAGSGAGDDRRRGWREALESRGELGPAAIDALDVAVEDSVSLASERVRALLDSGVAFDAVVCASDTLALGASMALGARGVGSVGRGAGAGAGVLGAGAGAGALSAGALGAGAPGARVAAAGVGLGAGVEGGSSVPIVGYDDTPVASALGLSSVEQPLVEVADAVLELLLDDVGGPRQRLLNPRTVWR